MNQCPTLTGGISLGLLSYFNYKIYIYIVIHRMCDHFSPLFLTPTFCCLRSQDSSDLIMLKLLEMGRGLG